MPAQVGWLRGRLLFLEIMLPLAGGIVLIFLGSLLWLARSRELGGIRLE